MSDSNWASKLKFLEQKDKYGFASPGRFEGQSAFQSELKQILKDSPWFKLFLDACLGCGACSESCPDAGTGLSPWNTPWARLDLARRAFSQIGLKAGIRRALAGDDPHQGEELLEDWRECFFSCHLCRSCLMDCPLSIDVSLISRRCRQALDRMGLTPERLVDQVRYQYDLPGRMGFSGQELRRACQSMTRTLSRELGFDLAFPVDEPGAEVLLIPSSGDWLDQGQGIKAYAKIFYAAGVSWTMSSRIADASNSGYWVGDNQLIKLHEKALAAARELGPDLVIWGESGHGWAVADRSAQIMHTSWAELESLETARPLHIYEWLYHMLKLGAFEGKLERNANETRMIAYHDPCHLVHSARLRAEPRFILRASAPFVFDLPHVGVRGGESALCCGAGGGVRQAGSFSKGRDGFAPLAGLLVQAMRHMGVDYLASGCRECVQAIREGVEQESLPINVGSVVSVMGDALYPVDHEAEPGDEHE